jgi:TPR repeat protein
MRYRINFEEDDFMRAEEALTLGATGDGNPKACLCLGKLYYYRFGHSGNKLNLAQAIRHLRDAVDEGVPYAQKYLGVLIRLQESLERREATDLQLAQHFLDSYTSSHEESDFTEALKRLETLAARGSVEAKRKIGELYTQRFFSTIEASDWQRAIEWFREAVRAGDAESQRWLKTLAK